MAYRSIRRYYALPRLWDMAFAGVPRKIAFQTLKNINLSFRSQTMSNDWNRISQTVRFLDKFPEWDKEAFAPKNIMPDIKMPSPKKYKYVVRVTATDMEGEETENYVSFYSDRFYKGQSVMNAAQTVFNAERYNIAAGSENWIPEVIYHNKGKGF